MSTEVAAESDGSSPVKATQFQKDVERAAYPPRRQHLIALVIATFCHFTRPSAAEGESKDSSLVRLLSSHSIYLLNFILTNIQQNYSKAVA